jgi:hypothetical protein
VIKRAWSRQVTERVAAVCLAAAVMMAGCSAPGQVEPDGPAGQDLQGPADQIAVGPDGAVAGDSAADGPAGDTGMGDVGPDAPADGHDGAPPDLTPDAPADAAADGSPDAPVDAPADAPADGPVDAPPADATSVVFTPITYPLLSQLVAYEQGGTIDVDGDGVADLTITIAPDGTRTVVLEGPKGPTGQIVDHGPDDIDAGYDQDADGRIDRTYRRTRSGATTTEVTTIDTNLDGVMDRRETTVSTDLVPLQSTSTSTIETLRLLPDGSGRDFQVDSTFTTDGFEFQCAPPPPPPPGTGAVKTGVCLPASDLPTTWATARAVSQLLVADRPNIRGLQLGKEACSTTRLLQLQAGLMALNNHLPRLHAINDENLEVIMRGLADHDLLITCDIVVESSTDPADEPCTVQLKIVGHTTKDDAFGTGDRRYAIIHLADSTFAHPAGIEETLIHELLHLGGKKHMTSENGEGQRDEIYACGRYTSRCAGRRQGFYLGAASEASSPRDSALCALPINKHMFGTAKVIHRSEDCFTERVPFQPMPALTCDMPAVVQCGCCREQVPVYCDSSPELDTERLGTGDTYNYVCCESCPGITQQNGGTCLPTGQDVAPPLAIVCPPDILGCGY